MSNYGVLIPTLNLLSPITKQVNSDLSERSYTSLRNPEEQKVNNLQVLKGLARNTSNMGNSSVFVPLMSWREAPDSPQRVMNESRFMQLKKEVIHNAMHKTSMSMLK